MNTPIRVACAVTLLALASIECRPVADAAHRAAVTEDAAARTAPRALARYAQATPPPAAPTMAQAVSRTGVLDGAAYRIEVPAGWHGGLVLFAHGYEGEGPGPGSVRPSPMGAYLLGKGYAWAASGYRTRGYRPDLFIQDMLALRELFLREMGRPRWIVLHGQSMGGHVTITSVELHPDAYQGALIECGAIDGIAIGDFYYSYWAAAEYFSGLTLIDPAAGHELILKKINEQWLPLMGTPGAYSDRGRSFDSVMKHLMGGDLPLRVNGLRQRFLLNFSRIGTRLDGEPLYDAVDTTRIRYRIDPGLGVDEAELNARIRRKSAAPGARIPETNPVFSERTGRIKVPVLAIHETGDARVSFALQQSYRRRTLAAGTADLLVQRAVRWAGHCVFDGEIREQAFDDLVAWIEKRVKPDGDDVLAADVSKIGLRWTPILHPDDPVAKRP